MWESGTLKAGNLRSSSLVRSSTNLIDTSAPARLKVDILIVFVVYECRKICGAKRFVPRSMGGDVGSLVKYSPRSLGEWGAARLGGAGENKG
jgi:hypothetical protein